MTENEFRIFLEKFKNHLGGFRKKNGMLLEETTRKRYYNIVGGAENGEGENATHAKNAKKAIIETSKTNPNDWVTILLRNLEEEKKKQKGSLFTIDQYGNGEFGAALKQIQKMNDPSHNPIPHPVILPPTVSSSISKFDRVTISRLERELEKVGYEFTSTNRYIKSLLAKPFVILTGNSGTGKSKMATLFADWLVGEEGYAFVPVGADWTDNRNVLGYVNMLKTETQTIGTKTVTAPVFQGTEVIKLIVRATENEEAQKKPWFLILDEMNLSHVERYFSDFLAHIESPDKEIRLHHEETSLLFLDDKNGGGRWVELPPMIKLPENLFVVGTVNVDETTYMFSPKVLDRANVIEFRTSHDALQKAQNGTHGKFDSPLGAGSAADFLNLSQKARGLVAGAALPDPITGWDEYKAAILAVFDILQRRGLEFGFRVQKEMLAYARVDYHFHSSTSPAPTGTAPATSPTPAIAGTPATHEETQPPADNQDSAAADSTASAPALAGGAGSTTAWDWQGCFDEQMMQKVLPKLHGDQAKLEPVLAALIVYCRKDKTVDDAKKELNAVADRGEKDFDTLEKIERGEDKSTARFPMSFVKLSRMMEVLRRDQFVSFIQ